MARITRTSWVQRLETGAVVTLITVLIWLYAENKNTHTFEQQIHYRFVPAAEYAMAIEPDNRRVATITFRASTAQNALLNQLADERSAFDVPIRDRAAGEAASQEVDLREKFSELFADLGIAVDSVYPPTEAVRAERLESVSVPVRVTFEADVAVRNTPTVDPGEIPLSVPSSFVTTASELWVEAVVPDSALAEAEVNVATTREVELRVPEAMLQQADSFQRRHLNLIKKTVRVTFTVSDEREQYTLERVKLLIQDSPLVRRKYELDVPDDQLVLPPIQISGPREVIERIRDREVEIEAVLKPTLAELDEGVRSFTPRLTLPPGVIRLSNLDPVELVVIEKQ